MNFPPLPPPPEPKSLLITSTEVGELFAALAKFQGEVPVIPKNKTVDFTGPSGRVNYKYADIADILNACHPVLSKHGLAFIQGFVNSKIFTRVAHSSGQWMESQTDCPLAGDPKKQAITMTYMRRYTGSAILGIAADEDMDAPPEDDKDKDKGKGNSNGNQSAPKGGKKLSINVVIAEGKVNGWTAQHFQAVVMELFAKKSSKELTANEMEELMQVATRLTPDTYPKYLEAREHAMPSEPQPTGETK